MVGTQYEVILPGLSEDEWKVSAKDPKLPITVEITHAEQAGEPAVFQIIYQKKADSGVLATKGLRFVSPTLVKKCASLAKALKVGKEKNQDKGVANYWSLLGNTDALIKATESDSDASATAKGTLTAAQLQQINTISRRYATTIKNFQPPGKDDAEITKFKEQHDDFQQYLQKNKLFALLHAFEKNPRLDTRFELRLHVQDKKKQGQKPKPDPYHIVLVRSAK